MIDEAKIYVRSGTGGSGMVHFHREKFVSRGGPDGGDGGRGGSVILVGASNLNTLHNFVRQQQFVAEDGRNGGPNEMSGAAGGDLRVRVPLGTLVRDADTGELLADMVESGQEVVIAKGGRGGRGNQHYASSVKQAPRIAERGEPGTARWLRLELRLMADVGIVGMPNAGKSTLLSVISNAKPKIAAYPFTTLEPNLGMVVVGDRDIVFADIPGLVEGAHMGVGLGHSFLRHIQRTRVLVHLLNGENENPLADFNQINAELALFDEKLVEKPQIVALNKMDLPDMDEKWAQIERELTKRGYQVMSISAATQLRTRDLVNRAAALLATQPAELPATPDVPVFTLKDEIDMAFTIERNEYGEFLVRGPRIERAAAMTYWEFDESVRRFQKLLEILGISKALEKAGVKTGDTVFIGDFELEWSEEQP
jgi:GTP-binding protein